MKPDISLIQNPQVRVFYSLWWPQHQIIHDFVSQILQAYDDLGFQEKSFLSLYVILILEIDAPLHKVLDLPFENFEIAVVDTCGVDQPKARSKNCLLF